MIEIGISGEKSKSFKTLIDVLQGIVVGPRKWNFDPEKIVMASMEDSSAVFVMFEMRNSFFESYSVDAETSLGLSLDDLKKVFSRSIKDSTKITMKFNSETNKFIIVFDDGATSTAEYKLNVHVPEEDNSDTISKVKQIPLDSEITFEGGGHLKNILSDVGIVAQKDFKHLALIIDKKSDLIFELKGDATGIYAKSVLKMGDGSPIREIRSDSDRVESLYDMENLEKLFKIDAISDTAKMELGSENPLRLTFNIADNGIEFVYLVAPLDTEEEDDF